MRAFVTGATGVVGGALVRHLVETGDEVTAYVRRPVRVDGASTIVGSLGSHRSLAAAMEGHAVAYHVAGVNALCSKDPAEMYRVNVDGTRSVVRAAAAVGIGRLVHTSSVAVASRPAPSHYARSKRLAEEVALNQRGLDVVAVRPASVQGPGRATGSTRVLLDILNGRLPLVIDSTVSIVDIDDCAAGHRAAALRGRPGSVYTLSGFSMSIREALEVAFHVLGRAVPVRYLSPSALPYLMPLAMLGRLLKSDLICPEMLRTLRHDHRHDGSTAAAELGLEYRTPEATFGRMLEWFQEAGLIG